MWQQSKQRRHISPLQGTQASAEHMAVSLVQWQKSARLGHYYYSYYCFFQYYYCCSCSHYLYIIITSVGTREVLGQSCLML